MEIERKYLLKEIPEWVKACPYKEMEQSYISRSPVIRVRHIVQDGRETFILTLKGRGLSMREEYELDLNRLEYLNLLSKAEGRTIEKRRYLVPLEGGLTAEVDEFSGELAGLKLVEVEFPSEEAMRAFCAPEWFGRDVSEEGTYQNSRLSDPHTNIEDIV